MIIEIRESKIISFWGGKNSEQAEIFRINSEYGPLSQKKSPLKSQSRKLVKIQDGRRDITEI